MRAVASPDARDVLAELEASLTWARPTGFAPPVSWHKVASIGAGSITTVCAGRWSLLDPYETSASPPVDERCKGCTRVDRALTELKHAAVIETSRVPVLFEAWDCSDLDNEPELQPPPLLEVEVVIDGRTDARLRVAGDRELDAAINAAIDAEERD